ncbi:MAG TPA: hypothetical protein VMB71_04070 [Acetobacteraceae bacterium]|nr:hypothetical protein [Acetobacteraceae bacterium]
MSLHPAPACQPVPHAGAVSSIAAMIANLQRIAVAVMGQGRKKEVFFFEKKKQKTSDYVAPIGAEEGCSSRSRGCRIGKLPQQTKAFWFFLKKEHFALLCFSMPYGAHRQAARSFCGRPSMA